MFARPIDLLIAVSALLYMDHVLGQCISTPYFSWNSCGVPRYDSPQSCDRADLFFHIYRETNCVSSNPVVTLDFTAPIARSGDAYGYIEGDSTSISGDVSDDQLSITFDMGEAGLDPFYVLTQTQDHYYWYFWVILDNCDTAYTWSDNFVQLSYVDDEQNIIDLSGFEDPNIDETETGICSTPSPITPTTVTDATPAPTPAPTMRGAYCHGDPHCQTFDGLYYDCHGDGDFVLLESAETGSVVHARFEPLISPDASFTTGVAATEDGSAVIEVTVSDGERTILIDGEVYAYDEGDGLPATMTGVTLTVTDQNVDMLFPSGLQVNVRRWFTDPNYIGGVYVYAPLDMSTVGVLGTNNGNRADDWTDSTGETIDTGSPSVAEGYNYCTSNWKAEESLLTTSSRLRSRRLQTSNYVAPVIPDVIPTDVEELCGDNTECIFDAIVVGLDVGAATLAAGEEFETEVQASGGDVCEENTYSSDGLSPCTECPEGETSGRGAVVCEGTPPTPSPTVVEEPPTPNPTPSPTPVMDEAPPTPSPAPPTSNPTPSPTPVIDEAPPTPSPTPGLSTTTGFAPDSLGCYEDDREDRIMDDLALSDDSMTTELCELTCLGSTFFATQYGREVSMVCTPREEERSRIVADVDKPAHNDDDDDGYDVTQHVVYSKSTEDCSEIGFPQVSDEWLPVGLVCWCGSESADYALHGESTDCTYTCAGDADQTCGGFYAANVYRYTDESTPNPTPSPTATGPLALGCYEDDREDRIMDDLAFSDYSMTTECWYETIKAPLCFIFSPCLSVMNRLQQCFCGGSSTDLLEHGESSACNYECPGDSEQVCGGFYAMSVHSYYS
ncbi:unnamed protein product [Ectocarpus fasciculatus]